MTFWLLLFCWLAPRPPEMTPEQAAQQALAKVRRIFIADLSGGESAVRIRDLIMTSLQNSKVFVITEDEDNADAIVRGSAEDTVFTDTFQSSDNINAHTQASTPDRGNSTTKYSSRGMASMSIGENESRRTEERKHEAIATVRLVDRDGDVIWSTTQESLGGKFLGASADVAEKVAKRLAGDFRVARKLNEPKPQGTQ